MIKMESRMQTRASRAPFWWATALGVLMIMLGIAAIAQPFVATITATLFLGWLFVIGGVIKFVYSLATREAGSLAWKLLLSILYFAAGLGVLFYPFVGVITLTLVLGVFFIIKGLAQIAFAYDWRPESNWGWPLAAGILGIVVGLLILSQLPSFAAWVLGLLVGINLLFDGIWIIMFSSAGRKMMGQAEKMERKAA